MMAAPVKSPVRAEIEAEVIGILSRFDRPMSAAEIFVRTETAEDKAAVMRIIGHMREAGTIIRDEDIPVGELGGMPAKAKGARPVASYRLPTEVERAEIDAATKEASPETAAAPQPTVKYSLMVDHPVDAARKEDPTDDLETAHLVEPTVYGDGPGIVCAPEIAPPAPDRDAFLRSIRNGQRNRAGEKDLADYLDTAASSANGDESASPWSRILAEGCHEDHQWESDLLQACETSRESLLTIADQLLAGHPVWSAARAVDRALTRLADDYV